MAKVTAYAPFQSAPATTAEAETTKLRLKHESEVKALSEGPKSDDVTNLIEAKRENFRLETGLWTEHPDVMLARLKRDDDNRLAGLASRLNFAVKFAYE
jgi:hypothetical protein